MTAAGSDLEASTRFLIDIQAGLHVYLMVRGGSKKEVALALGTGLVLTFGAVFVEVQSTSLRIKFSSFLHYQNPVHELPPGWGQNFSPEQRKLSIFLARAAFNDHGRLIQYMQGDGMLVTFAPTEEDIRCRGEVIAAKAGFDAVNAFLPSYPIRWLSMSLTAFALGAVLGRSGMGRKTRPHACPN
ncbi:MAG: hypothetical protein M3N82_00005 [Pseudomonadota bacterium]|nr:hypothetical protein [Pseudomonadota bacterium]